MKVGDSIFEAWTRLDSVLHNKVNPDQTPHANNEPGSLKPIISKLNSYRPSSRGSRIGEFRISQDITPMKQQPISNANSPQKSRPVSAKIRPHKSIKSRPTTPLLIKSELLNSFANGSMTLHSNRNPLSSRRASQPIANVERFSPKLQEFDELAIIHSVPFYDLGQVYEQKCSDNKYESNMNQLKHFVEKYAKLSKNRNFNLEDQNIGPKAATKIAEILGKNSHFVRLLLGRNFVGDAGAKAIAQALLKNETIIHLDLTSNNIGPEGTADIFKMLLQNKTIISVKLNSSEGLFRNRLDSKGMIHITEVLQKNTSLTFLNVGGSCITPLGAEYIAQGLHGNKYLIALDVSGNDLGPTSATHLSKALANSNVKEFYINDNILGDKGVKNLVQMFLPVSTRLAEIEVLDLSGNKITPFGATKVFDALTRNTSVYKLIMNKNNLSGKGIAALANFMMENRYIKHLSLCDCEMGIEGAEALANGLLRNKSIETLLVANNRFKDQGVKVMCLGLSDNFVLKHLDLSCCLIHNDGGKHLSDLLKKNHTLRVIELKDNTCYDEVGLFLIDSIKYNKQLVKVSLERNPMSFKYVNEIYKLIQTHKDDLAKSQASNVERVMEELKVFEGQKYFLDDERKEVVEKFQDIKQELTIYQENYDKVRREEDAKYAELEAYFNQQWVDMRKLEEIWDEQYDEIKKMNMELAQYQQMVISSSGRIYDETRRAEEDIIQLTEQIKQSKEKYDKELAKVKKDLEAEESRMKYQEGTIATLKNQIQRWKDSSRKDLKKALEEINAIKDVDPNEKRPRKSTKSKRSTSELPVPERRNSPAGGRKSIMIKGPQPKVNK